MNLFDRARAVFRRPVRTAEIAMPEAEWGRRGEHQADTGPSDTVDPAGERPSRQALALAVDRPVELDRLWLAEHKAAAELNHMETGKWEYGWYYTPEQWEEARQEAQRTRQAREARFPEAERPTTQFQDWWSQVGRPAANPDTERLSASVEPAGDSDSAADSRGGEELRDGGDDAGEPLTDPDIERERAIAQAARSMSVQDAREVLYEEHRASQNPASYDQPDLIQVGAAQEVLDTARVQADEVRWDQAVEELAESISPEQGEERFEQIYQRQLRAVECGHDDFWDCDSCIEATEHERGTDWDQTAQVDQAVRRVMARHNPDAVAAAEDKLAGARERAAAEREQHIDRTARGMTSDEAREVLDQATEAHYNALLRRPDSRDVEAARRVIASRDAAIERTQPTPDVVETPDAASASDEASDADADAEQDQGPAEKSVSPQPLAEIRAALDQLPVGSVTEEQLRSVGVTHAEFAALAAAEREEEVEQHQQRRERDIADAAQSMSVDQARAIVADVGERAEHRAGCQIPVEECGECSVEENLTFDQAYIQDIDLAAARSVLAQGGEVARDATPSDTVAIETDDAVGDTVGDTGAERELDTHDPRDAAFEDALGEEIDAERQLDEALNGPSLSTDVEQAEVRWRAAVQNRDAAWQARQAPSGESTAEVRLLDGRGEREPMGFGFVAPSSRGRAGDAIGAAVESARDAVTDLQAQRVEAVTQRAEYDRAQQTNLWGAHPHDTGIEHGDGLSADGYGTGW